MKVVKLEAIPVRIAYKHVEASSLIARGGIADVLVKVTTEDGIVGWGECTRAADVPGIESAVKAMAPLVVGRSAWDREIMQRELAVYAVWAFQPMTANFAFAGIDMALWDACGKACGQPLYRLFGGAMREEVDYFYYMEWGTPKEIARQARDGVKRGYRAYYIKAGVDEAKEEAMLEALRDGIGPGGNVYAELGSTWFNLSRDLDSAGHVLGKLLTHLGAERILWGTDSIWYGSPQGQIDAFRAFEITPEAQERYGYPALTPEMKDLILGGNAARLYGV